MGKIIDLTGRVFGRLEVISFVGKDKFHKARWSCICECGTKKIVAAQSLMRGYTKSCGCYRSEINKSEKRRKQNSEINIKMGVFVGENNPGYGMVGSKNVSNRPEIRKKIAASKIGDNNPAKRPEVREKLSKSKIGVFAGENHPNWKGGISSENDRLRSSIECRVWRQKVFKRDRYICQKCVKNKSKHLNAHHIESFNVNKDLISNIDNGITLCKYCHIEFHSEYGYGNNNRKQLNDFLNN